MCVNFSHPSKVLECIRDKIRINKFSKNVNLAGNSWIL